MLKIFLPWPDEHGYSGRHCDGWRVVDLHPDQRRPAGLTVVHRMIGGIDSFPLLAVPFFIPPPAT